MGLNFRRLVNGLQIVPKTTSTASLPGELDFDTTSNKLNLNNGTITDQVVTEADVATITNKTIDAGSNTITNLVNANLSGSAAVSNANLAAMPTLTLKGNNTGGSATPQDLTVSQVNTMLGISGAATSIGALDAQPENADGLALVSGVLSAQSADATHPGLVNNTTQTFSGQKTFSTGITGTLTGNATNVTGTVAIANGGTGQTSASAAFNALNPMTTTGDLIYESATNVASRLPIGTSGQVLTVSGGIPSWQNDSGTSNPINLTQISTPSTPASGSNDLYFKATSSSQIVANSSSSNSNYSDADNTVKVGQSFTPTLTGTIISGILNLKYESGAPTGTLVTEIYTDSAGTPGTLLGTSNTINASTLTTSFAPYTFTFTSGPSLTASTKYHLVLDFSGVTFNAGAIDTALDTSNPYAGGNSETYNGAWTEDPYDLQFSVTSSVSDNGQLYTLNSNGIESSIGSGGITGTYWAGNHNYGYTWHTTSSSFVDPSSFTTGTFNQTQNANFGSVTTAASNNPGITFSPVSSSAVYLVTVLVGVYNASVNSGVALSLTDGTNVISQPGIWVQGPTAANSEGMLTLTGIWIPGTTSPVTLKLQMYAAGGGTAEMTGGEPGSNTLEWTLVRIA